MTSYNALATRVSTSFQQSLLLNFAAIKLKLDHIVCLVLTACAAAISTAIHNPTLIEILLVAFIATSFEQQFLKVVEQIKKNIKLWQLAVVIGGAVLLIIWGMHPVNAQVVPNGGLFNPLQTQTNAVLQAAGAGQAGTSLLGIFPLMNILVTIAGVSAVVFGAYQQTQGHTLRESFTPLALVLLVYLGCSFVMRMFLGTNGA